MLSFCFVASAAAQQQKQLDGVGDAAIRRIDFGADAPTGSESSNIPDIVSYQLGAWQPANPATSLYGGMWSNGGQFVRFDLVLNGLVNPPGPINQVSPTYDPFYYGPSPLIGFVEFNIDQDVNTGGELDFPEFRYLANLGRFGGIVDHADWRDRAAVCGTDIDQDFMTAPFVDRSGEEFHIAFSGDTVLAVTRRIGDDDDTFEPGEAWSVTANWLHRAHSFERFSSAGNDGIYEPQAEFLFQHAIEIDQTIITMIFPLTNAAAADALELSTESNNGVDSDQASIQEGLSNLTQSVMAVPIGDPTRLEPEFQAIRPWENQSAAAFLDPASWEVNIIVGMPYTTMDAFGALYAPTDVMPSPIVGDFDGDGIVKQADVQAFDSFLEDMDGLVGVDADLSIDGAVTLVGFGPNFCVYDINYDGVIDTQDRKQIVIMGDVNLDLKVNVEDLEEFVTLLLNSATEPDPIVTDFTRDKFIRANFFVDGVINGKDIQGFVDRFLVE